MKPSMPDQHLYEYAVIRVVPRVEREEFLNVGVVVFCKKQGYLRARLATDLSRIRVFVPHIDLEEVVCYLNAFVHIAAGIPGSSPIGTLDAPSRFRWLTAVRSTVVQTSRLHPGFCPDLDSEIERLLQLYTG